MKSDVLRINRKIGANKRAKDSMGDFSLFFHPKRKQLDIFFCEKSDTIIGKIAARQGQSEFVGFLRNFETLFFDIAILLIRK